MNRGCGKALKSRCRNRGKQRRLRLRGPAAEITNAWHCRLLRTRRERPRGYRAAEERDEFASFQMIELHSVAHPAGTEHQGIELGRISQQVWWGSLIAGDYCCGMNVFPDGPIPVI
jgi:hypothetical protein